MIMCHTELVSVRRRLLRQRIRPLASSRGASLVEYALLVALIAIACVVAIDFLGVSADGNLRDSGTSMFGP